MMKGFLLQLKFLTRFPFFNVEFDEEKFARGIIFAPVIGLLIGGILSVIYLSASIFDSKIVTAICIVFFGTVLTGGLHIDGLADTCDGVFSGRSREKMLEIMKDSRIGTNGTVGIFFLLASKTILLAVLDDGLIVSYLLAMPVLSRYNIILASGISKYARETKGMGESVIKKTGIKEIIIGTVITLIICIPVSKFMILAFFPVSAAFTLIFISYVKSKLGGITGDVIGATIELSEVIFLAAAFLSESSVFKDIILRIMN